MAEGGYLKFAVRAAIADAGGIEAVAAALNLSTSTIGRWNNLNDVTLPNRAQRFDLDELAMACGGEARIIQAMARKLGHVAFRLPQPVGDGCEVTMQMMKASEEFGDVAGRLVDALSDGRIDAGEQVVVTTEIDDAIAALVMLRALVVDDETRLRGASSNRATGDITEGAA